VLLASAQLALAGKMVLRIRAGNPIEKPQTVQVKAALPARVSTNNVISLGGLSLGYDVKSDVYYVHGEVDLGPKEIREFDIEMQDIWVIDLEQLEALRRRAREMGAKLSKTRYGEDASLYQQKIEKRLDAIAELQAKSAIGPGVKPYEHIRAYEANLEDLESVKRDVGRIENLVLATGQDLGPEPLLGEVALAPRLRREIDIPEDEYRTAVIRVTVKNTSPSQAREVSVRRNLPPEIGMNDVLDSGGLLVGVDAQTGAAYVYTNSVTVPPESTISFDVRIRDKWDINARRIDALHGVATNLLDKVAGGGKYESVEITLRQLADTLESLQAAAKPKELNDAYVAFFRKERERLEEVERKLNRIESILKPIQRNPRYGFDVEPPSSKTTWLIIYIILGFLAVVSLLFFLRWYGKTRAEKL
jgi:hypothetical protein